MNFIQKKNYNNRILIDLLHKLNKINNSFTDKKIKIISSNKVFTSNFNFFRFICEHEELRKNPLRDIIINYFHKSEYTNFIGIQNKIYARISIIDIIGKCLDV